ncbi:unnamed protein product, partial [Sphagnum balticum]
TRRSLKLIYFWTIRVGYLCHRNPKARRVDQVIPFLLTIQVPLHHQRIGKRGIWALGLCFSSHTHLLL